MISTYLHRGSRCVCFHKDIFACMKGDKVIFNHMKVYSPEAKSLLYPFHYFNNHVINIRAFTKQDSIVYIQDVVNYVMIINK